MSEPTFQEAVQAICRRDDRYTEEAYAFVCEALHFTNQILEKPKEGPERHVSGQQLLEGARRYALHEYGPMARTVLRSWGLNRTEDLGEIVFNLVETGLFGKTDEDERADFANGYDFDSAFCLPFQPSKDD